MSQTEEQKQLYVLAFLNEEGLITGFPVGGGSSQPSHIRAFQCPKRAAGSRARMKSQTDRAASIIKVTNYEILEG